VAVQSLVGLYIYGICLLGLAFIIFIVQKWKAQKQGGGEAAHCTDTEVEAGPSGSATSEGSEASGIEHPACRSELDLLCQVIVPEQSPNIGAPSAREKPPIASTDHDCKSLLRPHMGFVLPPRLLLA